MIKLSKVYTPIFIAIIAILVVGYYYIDQLNNYNQNSLKLEQSYNLLYSLNTLEKNILEKEKIITNARAEQYQNNDNFKNFNVSDSKSTFQKIDTLLLQQNRTIDALDTLKAYTNTIILLLTSNLEQKLNNPEAIEKEKYYINKIQLTIYRLSQAIEKEVKIQHLQKQKFEKNRRSTEAILTTIIFTFFIVAVYYLQKFIAENNRFQKELHDRNYDLKILNKEILELYFANAHNLKEPMRKIQMIIDLSKQQNNDLSLTFERIKNISAEQQSTNKNILQYYEVLSRSLKLELIDLNNFFNHYIVSNGLNQKLIINIHELPIIKGDLNQITQLFDEIIQNTLDFNRNQHDLAISIQQVEMSKKDIHAKYQIDNTQQYVILAIDDNGIGVPSEYHTKIFELFQKINQNKSFEHKKGMGLSFCKRIMLNHKGIIVAENNQVSSGLRLLLFFPSK